jgi:hypothetical protein
MPVSKGLIIALVICVCVVSAGIAVGIYYATKKPADDTTTPAAPTDPRKSVWDKGQKIQEAPLEIIQGVTASILLAPQPILPATVTYSVSMDVFITRQSAQWLEFFTSNPVDSWEGPNGGHPTLTNNHPLCSVSPTGQGNVGGIVVRHNDATTNYDSKEGETISNTVKAKYGQWFNFFFRINGSTKKVETYIDGVRAGSTNYTNTPVWDSVPGKWGYGNAWKYCQDAGSTKVANVYFFNTYLADADIPLLKIPTAPTTGVATTSYYEPEPAPYGSDDA